LCIAVREDPAKRGLLYAGTEHGIYVSFDDGGQWQSLRLNLPDTQVPDLVIEGRRPGDRDARAELLYPR